MFAHLLLTALLVPFVGENTIALVSMAAGCSVKKSLVILIMMKVKQKNKMEPK